MRVIMRGQHAKWWFESHKFRFRFTLHTMDAALVYLDLEAFTVYRSVLSEHDTDTHTMHLISSSIDLVTEAVETDAPKHCT